MHKQANRHHAASILAFHAVVLLAANWFASYLPSPASDRALLVLTIVPISLFWVVYGLRQSFNDLTVGVLVTCFLALALGASWYGMTHNLAVSAAAPVINMGPIGSHTFSQASQAGVYATAAIFYAFLTYALSVLIAASLELAGAKLLARVPVVMAATAQHEVAERPSWHLYNSPLFMEQRSGMITAVCLTAMLLGAYLALILR